jgi:hypothetical protein
MPDITLDVFDQDAFNTVSLTDSINNRPFVPGRAGSAVEWDEEGVATTTIMIEEENGTLKLLNPVPRGGPGETSIEPGRKVRSLVIPHYQHDDTIMADSVQNVRQFGTTDILETLRNRVDTKLLQHTRNKLDPTLEYQRIGALKGVILNANGSVLYNLFDEFSVTQEAEVDFDLDNASPASGALRRKCANVVRKVIDNLGGDMPAFGVRAFCGNNFFDDLLANPEVVESYKGTPMAQVLRDGYVTPAGQKIYGAFEFGGIVFENYRGSVGGTSFIDTDKCSIFPYGVPGLYRTVYAPADYETTVNTIGLPRYAHQYPMANGKGRHLESQMNALNYCIRPKSLMKGKRT